jgi:hypothetical protein
VNHKCVFEKITGTGLLRLLCELGCMMMRIVTFNSVQKFSLNFVFHLLLLL